MDEVANVSETIHADSAAVWDALVNPGKLRSWMFGATVESDWKPGSAITWRGEWQGRSFEDHGVVDRVEPMRRLEYTHESGGRSHRVAIEILPEGDRQRITLRQDGNATAEAREHSEANWRAMLGAMRKFLEAQPPP